ncbi:MAG: hypothetical protein HY909_10965 [Deltaproteobacteria bacterium]|nr:hypothetical protein [Deltaproteobacteria bacterium]
MSLIEALEGEGWKGCLARTFEAWLLANGRSNAEMAALYEIVDAWLDVVLPPPSTGLERNG